MLRMLQTLLAGRFKPSFHWETKQVEGYALVVAKDGPKLLHHEGDPSAECETRRETAGRVVWSGCSMPELASYSLFPGMLARLSQIGGDSWRKPALKMT
jgi:uncharacterized protein (TIGR03435 family)